MNMASVFTFEPEPVKVASPWPTTLSLEGHGDLEPGKPSLAGIKVPPADSLADFGITKLVAEPQEGPVEYKLHLLLRPRRTFSATSTVQKVSGSYLSKSRASISASETSSKLETTTLVLAPSNQSRQNRLQHLTTQLLWRLQQSSPHHASSKSSLVLPVLPEADVELSASKGPGRLIAGLEESLGALYEIGVSDDGTFVGLTPDELEESVTVLRAMAYSLGCNLLVLRRVIVGDCQWSEEVQSLSKLTTRSREEKLWVMEVLVSPHLGSRSQIIESGPSAKNDSSVDAGGTSCDSEDGPIENRNEQLRISLTGSTTSGKSSLLGTLSTSTLDNGRGKSRLSLLKHRHEIVSGVTSSLAQELIGYYDDAPTESVPDPSTKVVNYASGNVSSWNDIHSASDPGRLVFVTDSAGHPRYRRTTVRGLVSWAPHWTLCCVAADDDEDSTGKIGATASSAEILGLSGHGIDLSRAHLELCLKLDLPLVVVITKLDLASKTGLRQTLAKVLSTLKSAGRKPVILPNCRSGDDSQLQSIEKEDEQTVKQVFAATSLDELDLLVPIVLTSAVTGSGIRTIHSLLRHVPILHRDTPISTISKLGGFKAGNLFHVDEVFTMAKSHGSQSANGDQTEPGFILSGYVRHGTFETGDHLLLGPFHTDAIESNDHFDINRSSSYPGPMKGSPKVAAMSSELHRASSSVFKAPAPIFKTSTSDLWKAVRITSLRYLRCPVGRLSPGQVATIAISSLAPETLSSDIPTVRRGMVLTTSREIPTDIRPPAYSRFTAIFKEPNTYVIPGSSVTVYTASIRASAKILDVKVPDELSGVDELFTFDDNASNSGSDAVGERGIGLEAIEITFQFSSSREWIEMGTQVLVTPASGLSMLSPPERGDVGSAGLDGFVGKIVSASM